MKHWILNKSTLILTTISLTAMLLAGCEQATQSVEDVADKAAPELKGITLVEEVKAEVGKTVIPYKKYVLDNGLKVILHEDHSDPLVHVDITYHVGSGREEPGKSGFAHFFEHMLFQGSENVADEEHFKIVTESGGTLNGSTSTDRTNYYQTVPANQLEKMLWLESDRMGFFIDSVTQEKYEVQRATVKNERGQNYDNRPYGLLRERVAQAMYPEGHPYSWPTIGYIEDLNRVNVNDLKAFFLRWYGPNNATLTIGGDIDEAETLSLIVKYFGPITRGPEVTMPEKVQVTLDADRYISMEDNVTLPLLYMSFPTVSLRHEDEAPLDILASIIGGGKTSLLYKNLVKNQFAVQANASSPCSELACTFNFTTLPHPASGKSLADLERIIRETLIEFEKRGVEDDDLTKVKTTMEASYIFGLQSVSGKVGTLAINETYSGNPNQIEKDIARYANVTKEDVMRVFKQYIKDKPAVIMSIVPNGKPESIAKADNFKPAPRNIMVEQADTSIDELQLRRTKTTFDRSKIPIAGINKAVEVPEIWNTELSNGIKVLGTRSLETPTTSLLLKVSGGHYFADTKKAGVASLLASMLSESTVQRSAEEMSKEFQKLGANVSVSAGNFYMNVNVSSLTKNLDDTLKLTKEKILEPAFVESEFIRVKSNAIEAIKRSKKDADYLARTAFKQLLNSDNITGFPLEGTVESIENITLEDVKSFYNTYFKPAAAQLIVVSDLDEKVVQKSIALLNTWKGKGPEISLEMPLPEVKAGVVYLVHKDNAAQSSIRIGKRSLKLDITGEYYKAGLMNFNLGGAFNSRINLNLREDKGYTYGARSGFSGDRLGGYYIATAGVRADATDKSVIEFVKEIKQFSEQGITAEELTFMRSSLNQRDARKYETPSAKLNFLAQLLEYELTPEFVKTQTDIIASISAEEINALAQKHLNIDEMIFVVVGNSEVLKPEFEALGYEVINYEI